jgi:hypothetical protein
MTLRRYINEAKMTFASIRGIAMSIPGVKVGMEFELVVKNAADVTSNNHDSYDSDFDGSSLDNDTYIDAETEDSFRNDIMQFFIGYHNTRREVSSAADKALKDYRGWLAERWEDFLDRRYNPWAIKKGYDYSDRENIDEFTDTFRDGFDNDKNNSVNAWLTVEDITHMSSFANTYNLDWPFYDESDVKSELLNSIAIEFKQAVGMAVNVSQVYHAGTRAPDTYVIEPDSSINPGSPDDAGLEFISPPLDINKMIEQLHKVKEWAASGKVAYTNGSTGLHINISMPNYSEENLDPIKLALFLGDMDILEKFHRSFSSYAVPALKKIKANIEADQKLLPVALYKVRKQMLFDAGKSIYNTYNKSSSDKNVSIHIKEGYVEFRSPGGNWLEMDIDVVINTMLRMVVALDIALDENRYKREYATKLYKLLTPTKDTSMALFSMWQAGILSNEAMKSEWAHKVLNTSNYHDQPSDKVALANKVLNKHGKLFKIIRNQDGYEYPPFSAPDYDAAKIKAFNWLNMNNHPLDFSIEEI